MHREARRIGLRTRCGQSAPSPCGPDTAFGKCATIAARLLPIRRVRRVAPAASGSAPRWLRLLPAGLVRDRSAAAVTGVWVTRGAAVADAGPLVNMRNSGGKYAILDLKLAYLCHKLRLFVHRPEDHSGKPPVTGK